MRAREVRKSNTVGKAEVARVLAYDALDNPAQYSTRSLQSIYAAAICEKYDDVRIDPPVKSDIKNNQHHRIEILRRLDYALHCDPVAEKERLRDNPHAFFDDWVWMLDPRKVKPDQLHIQPFKLFDFQRETVGWFKELWENEESGLYKKSRDMGASVIGCGFGLWMFLFFEFAVIGYGSYKEDKVTKKNSHHALLPKIIMILEYLPPWMQPSGWSILRHYQEKIITNPENGSQIIGETGDELGRAGRCSWFFADEFAFVRNQEASVAALSATSISTIYASTTRGPGTHFAQMERSNGIAVKIYRWVHDPRKCDNPEDAGQADPPSRWKDKELKKIGPVLFAQEYDCDDSRALARVIIPHDWVNAARKINLAPGGAFKVGGIDLGEMGDRSVLTIRNGGIIEHYRVWEQTDMETVCIAAVRDCIAAGVDYLAYDAGGIGREFSGHVQRNFPDITFAVVAVNPSGNPTPRFHEDAPETIAGKRFQNRITELWWSLRIRFWKTWKRVQFGEDWPDEECIQLPNNHPDIERLCRQLSSVEWEDAAGGKIRRGEKRTGRESPDDADALVQCEMPAPIDLQAPASSWSGGFTGVVKKKANLY